MKERPILFSGPMVTAIREGRKTQTRRVVKPQPSMPWRAWDGTVHHWQDGDELMRCPYGQPGDRLWVRETWHPFGIGTSPNWTSDRVIYRADNEGLRPFDGCSSRPLPEPVKWSGKQANVWRPSIFMPRWASRITLEVVSVRVERLHRIGELSAKAEGVEPKRVLSVSRGGEAYDSYSDAFADLWDSINEARGYGWDVNPFVWVVEFKPL